MIKYGIDVSEHQGKIIWKNVKSDFAVIRAGYGRDISQKDKFFEENYNGCKENNIPCGAYWYSYAVTADEAGKEAAVCLETLKGKVFEYPIFFDIEEPRQLALGRKVCTEIAKAFLEKIEKAGCWAGIYSSKSYLETYIDESLRKRYAVWVAHYGVSKTSYSGQFGIWQKSNKGSIRGIGGNVDLNECYIDYPSLMKDAGLNGYSKPATGKKIKHTKGEKITLASDTVYASSTAKKGIVKSGTFYLYDAVEVQGRYRITTLPEYCGRNPVGKYVTGWVEL